MDCKLAFLQKKISSNTFLPETLFLQVDTKMPISVLLDHAKVAAEINHSSITQTLHKNPLSTLNLFQFPAGLIRKKTLIGKIISVRQ